jgi:hypothetical protein
VWWVGYRGERKTGVDNVGVFEDDGRPCKRHPLLLDPSKNGRALHTPRGFALVGNDLYIASAWREDSHVARYRRHGDTFRFAEVVMTTAQLAAMVHPFDVTLGEDGRVYVSSQDSNTVVAVVPKTRRPAPVVANLRKRFPDGNFLPGTVVASSRGGLPAVHGGVPVDVPSPLGLELVLDDSGAPRHSVRGIVVNRGHLYVADEAGDAVKVFELKSGSLVARVKAHTLRSPVHLRLHRGVLYIGSTGRGSILALDLPEKAPRGKLKPRVVIDGKLDAPSGFDIGPDGDLYVAERKKRRLRRFSLKGKKRGAFVKDLPDMPEFLVYVPSNAT